MSESLDITSSNDEMRANLLSNKGWSGSSIYFVLDLLEKNFADDAEVINSFFKNNFKDHEEIILSVIFNGLD